MNAIEQFRAGMKELGVSDEKINETIRAAANFQLEKRRRKLNLQLNLAVANMTDDELKSLLEGGEQ